MVDVSSPLMLRRENAPDLAYFYSKGQDSLPPVMFLGGFRSDMAGTKATYLENWCQQRDQTYIRFDYRGHGRSGGLFEESCISDWRRDAQDILTHCTSRPVILVGSSMGGWISLLLAKEHPQYVHALVGIAAAPDFTSWMERDMNEEQRVQLAHEGSFDLPNDYDEPYKITRKLLEDGKENLLLQAGQPPLDIKVPVRLLQGKCDSAVAWQVAPQIRDNISHDDVQVIFQDQGDHSLSSPQDLAVLTAQIDSLS